MTVIKFITKNSSYFTLHIGYKDRYIEETVNTKFLGLQIDKHLNWKNHNEQMIPKLRGACYAMTSVVCISNINTFKSVYCACFHSVIKYGIILWGNSSKRGEMFTLQKKIIRIVAGAQHRTSYRSLFKQLETSPFLIQCIRFINKHNCQ